MFRVVYILNFIVAAEKYTAVLLSCNVFFFLADNEVEDAIARPSTFSPVPSSHSEHDSRVSRDSPNRLVNYFLVLRPSARIFIEIKIATID